MTKISSTFLYKLFKIDATLNFVVKEKYGETDLLEITYFAYFTKKVKHKSNFNKKKAA